MYVLVISPTSPALLPQYYCVFKGLPRASEIPIYELARLWTASSFCEFLINNTDNVPVIIVHNKWLHFPLTLCSI